MKNQNDNPFIIYTGRYTEGEILSGPEKTAKRIFELHSKYFKTAFVQYFFDGSRYGIFKKLFGKESKQINDNAVLYTVGLFRYSFLLLSLKPDIIHIITFERFAVLTFFARMLRKFKVIYNSHGVIAYENEKIKKSGYFYSLKDKFCERRFLKKADKIILPGESTFYVLTKYYSIEKRKLEIVPNGIDGVFNSVERRESSPIVKAVILNSSAYSKSGVDFLNKISASVDFPLEIYSIGKNSEIMVNNSNISLYYIDKLNTAGLAEFYRDKNVFLSLNDYDTFSISSAEAMAAGLILIVTENTGISVFIKDGVNGFKMKYGDTDILLNNLKKISAGAELRSNISTNSRAIFTSINWDYIYKGYFNIYSNILK